MIPKISFALLTKNTKGKFPIYLRYYDGSSQNKYISTGKVVSSKSLFNPKSARMRGNNDLAKNVNRDLDLLYQKATKVVSELYNNEIIDFETFKQKMKYKGGDAFHVMVKRMIDESLSSKNIELSTYRKYDSILRHFKNFDANISTQSINKHTILRFSKFLPTQIKRKPSSNYAN